MLEYFVPQITHKLKIFGPLGLKEFLVLAICLGISLILHRILGFGLLFVFLSTLIFGTVFIFIFVKINEMPLEKYLKNMFLFLFTQKKYFWKQRKREVLSIAIISEQKEKEKERLYRVVRESNLAILSDQINLGLEPKKISQKKEQAWKELLNLERDMEKKSTKFDFKKILNVKQKIPVKIEKEQKLFQTEEDIYKKLKEIGGKRIEMEKERQKIEERLKNEE